MLDSHGIVSLREAEGPESMVEAQRQLRLTELRVVRSKGARFFEREAHTYRQALDAFVWGLSPNRKVTLIFAFNEAGAFSLNAQLWAEGCNSQEADLAAADLVAGFDATLAATALPLRFADDAGPDLAEWHSTWHAELLPPGLRFSDSNCADSRPRSPLAPRIVAGNPLMEQRGIVIAQPRIALFASLDALLRSLQAAKCATRLIITFHPHLFVAEEIRLLEALRQKVAVMTCFPRTDRTTPATSAEVAVPTDILLRSFERDGKAIEISARIEATAPLPDTILNFAAGVAWGAHESSEEDHPFDRDWRRFLPLGQPLPQWIPSIAALEAMGTPITVGGRRPQMCEGVLLGRTTDGDEVRLSEFARESHVYACGATGSGKSTLLANMVLQDIDAGRGMILIDPHGDITSDVLARVPLGATKRVVAFDLADADFAPGTQCIRRP